MSKFQVFLSVVYVANSDLESHVEVLTSLTNVLQGLVADYELVVIVNGSTDKVVDSVRKLTGEAGFPNLQVYCLTKCVPLDTASWVGFENALGDYIVTIDPLSEDVSFLDKMLECAVSGAEVVFATNETTSSQTMIFRVARSTFNSAYKFFNGIHLAKEAPHYRILSRRVVNFILQHPHPILVYRQLPVTGGFRKAYLTYNFQPKQVGKHRFIDSVDRGIQLLVSTTRAPMRIVTALCTFGAVANVLYSLYVVAVGILKSDVAPGWISLSLQQSGMFFLLSLVLLVLGEYIINMAHLSNEGPLYHIGEEFTSAKLTRHAKLNVEESHVVARD